MFAGRENNSALNWSTLVFSEDYNTVVFAENI